MVTAKQAGERAGRVVRGWRSEGTEPHRKAQDEQRSASPYSSIITIRNSIWWARNHYRYDRRHQ
eukprot:6010742-Alexandrium_andersonii.AAC.1